jgi:hypothetical protein
MFKYLEADCTMLEECLHTLGSHKRDLPCMQVDASARSSLRLSLLNVRGTRESNRIEAKNEKCRLTLIEYGCRWIAALQVLSVLCMDTTWTATEQAHPRQA